MSSSHEHDVPADRLDGRARAAGTPLAARVLALLLAVTASAPFAGSGPVVFGLGLLCLAYALSGGRLVSPGRVLVAFLVWCTASLAWSVTPGQTIRGVLVSVALSLGVATLAARLGQARSLEALGTALKALILLSWALYLAVPSMGTEQELYHHGALTGVFVQRNSAAFVMAVAVLTFLFRALSDASRRRSAVLWTIVAAATLVATQSGTGLAVTTVCALGMLVTVTARRWSRVTKRCVLAVVLVVAAFLALRAQAVIGLVSELLGRDDTLTGRTVIWAAIEPYIAARPWHGYGWDALWTADSLITRAMWAVAGFRFPHAHDAYLDVLMQCGIVGLALLALAFLRVLAASGRAVLGGSAAGAWPMVVTVLLLLYGISEQSFMGYFGWLVLVLAATLTRTRASAPGPAVVGGSRRSARRTVPA
ncbi:O-antigen ligase family protein [Geodermatophilus sp. URMC 64]